MSMSGNPAYKRQIEDATDQNDLETRWPWPPRGQRGASPGVTFGGKVKEQVNRLSGQLQTGHNTWYNYYLAK